MHDDAFCGCFLCGCRRLRPACLQMSTRLEEVRGPCCLLTYRPQQEGESEGGPAADGRLLPVSYCLQVRSKAAADLSAKEAALSATFDALRAKNRALNERILELQVSPPHPPSLHTAVAACP